MIKGHGTEAAFGVEIGIGVGKAEPATGDVADAAPASRYDAEDRAHDPLRRRIAPAPNGAAVLVLDFNASGLKLVSGDTMADAAQKIVKLVAA